MTGSDFGNLGKGILFSMGTLMFLCAIFIPLGVWKLVEILVWLWNHIDISIIK